jgi:Glycosyl hydrolase family 9
MTQVPTLLCLSAATIRVPPTYVAAKKSFVRDLGCFQGRHYWIWAGAQARNPEPYTSEMPLMNGIKTMQHCTPKIASNKIIHLGADLCMTVCVSVRVCAGSDVVASTAAALAATSVAFAKADSGYAAVALQHARDLYRHANVTHV